MANELSNFANSVLQSSLYQTGKAVYDSSKNWLSKNSSKLTPAKGVVMLKASELKKYIKGQCPEGFIILNGGSNRPESKVFSHTYSFDTSVMSPEMDVNAGRITHVEDVLEIKYTLSIGPLFSDIVVQPNVIDKILSFYKDSWPFKIIGVYGAFGAAKTYYKQKVSPGKYQEYGTIKTKDEATINVRIRDIEKKTGSYYIYFFIDSYTYNDNHFVISEQLDTNIKSIEIPASDVAEEYMQGLNNRDMILNDFKKAALEAGAAPGEVDRLDFSSEEAIDQFTTKVTGVIVKKTDEQKSNYVEAATDPTRKAPEKITVTGGHRASIMQSKLSRENLEQGSNKKDDYYFDKRPGNAKLNDIYGMQTKLNAPGCIKLYKANGENGYQEPLSIDCFLLQSVQTSLKEKFSVFQSLSGDVLAYFFGKQPVIYRFSAALYNTYNQEWFHDFRTYYEKYLRASSSIGKNIRTVVSYENHVIEGFFLEMNMQESVMNTNVINIDFSILFIQDHVIGYDEPSFDSLDDETTSSGMYDVLITKAALNAPVGFTTEKPTGTESVTLSSDTLLRSSPEDLADNKLKVVKAGETITIDNNPVYGKNGDEWYTVTSGKYKDGERIGTNNAVYIKKDAVKGTSSEDPLANKKAFNPENPEAAEIKMKSDLNQQSKETEQIKKKVEAAKEKSKNFNSRLNASIKKDGTPVYTAASNQSPVIATLNKGDRCETLHNEGIYTKIVFNETTGFVESRKLKIGG